MAVRFDSESSCRRAYIDYYTNENTTVTAEDMRRIVQRYDSKTRQSWQAAFNRACNDENKYEFDDEQFEDIRLESYDNTEEEYGKDVNIKAEKARNTGDGLATGAGILGSLGSTGILGITAAGAKFGKLGKALATEFKEGIFKGGKKGGLVGYIISAIACIATFAVGLHAKLNKANEEEVKAVQDLSEEMETQQEIVSEQQQNLVQIRKDIQSASDKATEENNDANDDIDKLAGTHVALSGSFQFLQAKVNRGEPLSPTEAMQYNALFKLMSTTRDKIDTRTEKASETLNENLDIIGEFNSEFDVVATNIAEVKGITDYAAEIDEATQKSCTTQATIQKLNSTAAYTAAGGMAIAAVTFATQLGWVNPIAWVVTGLGAALAVLAVLGGSYSNKASQEQALWAQDTANEVALRTDVQAGNDVAQENYDDGVANYNESKAVLETSTINEPNGLVEPTHSNPFVLSNNNDNNGKPKRT